MADVTITITKADVFKEVARRTSLSTQTDPFYAEKSTERKQASQLHGEGDRITGDLLNEAAKEVLSCFVSRQGDVSGTPYENTSASVIYRFNEGAPVLTHAASIKERLAKNAEDAIIYQIMAGLYKIDGNTNKAALYEGKSVQVMAEINGDLYRLHD